MTQKSQQAPKKIIMPTYDQNSSEVLPEGEAKFRVKNAKATTSTSGNEMIELTLDINDGQATVFDNLVFVKAAYWKIDQFRIATGEVLKTATNVTFEAEHCIGREGLCELFIDEFDGRQRNKVRNYLFPKTATPVPAAAGATAPNPSPNVNEHGEPDDIPF